MLKTDYCKPIVIIIPFTFRDVVALSYEEYAKDPFDDDDDCLEDFNNIC